MKYISAKVSDYRHNTMKETIKRLKKFNLRKDIIDYFGRNPPLEKIENIDDFMDFAILYTCEYYLLMMMDDMEGELNQSKEAVN